MKNRFFETISSFCSSEYGVSSAVAAALLLGIIVATMTTIQLNYVPVWKEDAEYAHMSNVWQDMSRLKSNVDILAAGIEINPDARIVLNSPIRVGGSDVPFIGGTTTGGTLAVNNEISGLSIIITTDNATTEYNSGTSLFYTGTVTYHPTNSHYVDETYCYENGALIISRNGRSMMKLSPGIVLERDTGSVNLSVRAVTLDGNQRVMASNSIEDIRLTSEYFTPLFDLTGIEQFFNITSANLTVYTGNQEAWERYFENSAREVNLQKGTDYNITNGTYTVTLSLSPEDEDLYVNIYKAAIKVETGI
ncbi:hypothetical protein MSSIT_0190 [Methanosarcina siciliae T4/M]|uniref:Archaeal Type IV pilin N-terminal domain-containing protein n=2 Tax=Methanosarcina siciliae TaxID=38027 RepID=A0A0E3L9U4_9EURY|nr:hypothetical protein [Methanosarcina siciliae]AKB26909.1 hypothetical protein MSSIT_0190 [Methanosarcina siciliae T4/M]AKB30876.1 hypothetical protein MSSIH_0186 [Methanosarcina siciliae HI350]